MPASNYILTDIKVLRIKDSIRKAKKLFNESTLSHLPVIKNNLLIGMLAENDTQNIAIENDIIKNHLNLLQDFCTINTDIWIDLIKLFATNLTNILPVVDENKVYLGYFDLNDILHLFLETPFLSEIGYMIVVEKNTLEYSLSEISQIVEVNNAKLLGAFITKQNADIVQITLKISDHDINNTLQSFRRYNYHVIAGNLEDKYFEQLKNRSDYLQKFLNI